MRLILFFIFLCTFNSCSETNNVIYSENFNNCPNGPLPDRWWNEGSKAVSIENGHLRMDANPDGNGEDYNVSTVWLNQEFSGNLLVEFDAHIIASNDDKNNINFFFLFSDSTGIPLYESRESRANAQYKKYHSSSLQGYIFTYLADGNPVLARFRLRDCPGFHLLQEKYDYECRQRKNYHVTITRIGNRITQAVDDTVYVDMIGDKLNSEHARGLIGFRTWSTDLWWDNIKVIQISTFN